MKTIENIMDEVAKEYGFTDWQYLGTQSLNRYIKEACKRYAIEVAKASLEKASENADVKGVYNAYDIARERITGFVVDKSSITDEKNIAL